MDTLLDTALMLICSASGLASYLIWGRPKYYEMSIPESVVRGKFSSTINTEEL